MGLDMYAFSVPAASVGQQQIDIKPIGEKPASTEIAYWRKFNALHGWMENLYRAKGGAAKFNCQPVRIMPADLDKLEADMRSDNLKPTTGFFFGPQVIYPEDLESLKRFIRLSRELIADGNAVFYDSWW